MWCLSLEGYGLKFRGVASYSAVRETLRDAMAVWWRAKVHRTRATIAETRHTRDFPRPSFFSRTRMKAADRRPRKEYSRAIPGWRWRWYALSTRYKSRREANARIMIVTFSNRSVHWYARPVRSRLTQGSLVATGTRLRSMRSRVTHSTWDVERCHPHSAPRIHRDVSVSRLLRSGRLRSRERKWVTIEVIYDIVIKLHYNGTRYFSYIFLHFLLWYCNVCLSFTKRK